MANAINTQIGQSQDPNVRQFAPLANAVGQMTDMTIRPMFGALSNFAQQQPGGKSSPASQPNFTQPAPASGGFNPMAGNTTLPGNF
jgi:hypothetical protein